jgi:hypothetical protein
MGNMVLADEVKVTQLGGKRGSPPHVIKHVE